MSVLCVTRRVSRSVSDAGAAVAVAQLEQRVARVGQGRQRVAALRQHRHLASRE